jgi:uracil-DNA glycosylase
MSIFASLTSSSWKSTLSKEPEMAYIRAIELSIDEELRQKKIIYPPTHLVFNALNCCPIEKTKVVILGQDPYHGAGEAHGLAFSVPYGIKTPPSLKNIFKELEQDLPGFSIPNHGNLTFWAQQGVLLLNAILTVVKDTPASHQKIGWQQLTDQIIQHISNQNRHVVFILWGAYAQSKKSLIDSSKHLIIESAHPSPFSARKGFFGSRPFSKTNTFLLEHGLKPIDWQPPQEKNLFE